jgi:acyl transferase domain-containing protein
MPGCPFDTTGLLAQVHAFRQRVLFTEAAAQIPKNAIVLEIGPHSVLRSPLRQCRPELPYVATMKKSSEGAETVPTSVCELWRKGASLQWPVEPVPEDDTTAPERTPISTHILSAFQCEAAGLEGGKADKKTCLCRVTHASFGLVETCHVWLAHVVVVRG